MPPPQGTGPPILRVLLKTLPTSRNLILPLLYCFPLLSQMLGVCHLTDFQWPPFPPKVYEDIFPDICLPQKFLGQL